MKRQRGRNRGGSNGGGGGGGGKPQHNVNRAFDSNGPDNVKVRGNAQHVFEKYQQLARDASASGDRVLAENYLQHAEHYFRVLRAVQPNRPASEIIGRDAFASGFDIDFEDEGGGNIGALEEPAAEQGEGQGDSNGGEGQGETRADRQEREWQGRDRNNNDRGDRNNNRDRDDRPREDRFREDRPRDEQRQRDDRPREDRAPRDDRPREDRVRDDRPRDERPRDEQRPRDDRPREERPRRERFRDRDRDANRDKPRDPLAVVEPEATPLPAAASAPEDTSGHLRSQDGSLSPAPAFLQAREPREPRAEVAAPVAADETAEPVRKPRRRRATPRSFEGEAPPAPETEDA